MRPLDSGVIAPTEQSVSHTAEPTVDSGPETVLDLLQQSPLGALLDLPLPQLPADMPTIEPPASMMRATSEDHSALGAPAPAGSIGTDAALGAGGAPDLLPEASALLGDVNAIAGQVAAVADQAREVLGGALAAVPNALSAVANQAPAVALPPLPTDPVATLLQGIALPALPGVDLLIEPILNLVGSFGTGIIGALDPTALLDKSSQAIQLAMQVGRGSMASVDELWQSQAARNAQAASQQANAEGEQASQRGIDISELTKRAAVVVEQGNAKLLGIATSFAAEATALAPVIVTPPAQAALIASATDHLGRAVGVVNATRGDLAGKTAELAGVVQQLVAPGGGPPPHEIAQSLARNIGQPVLDQVRSNAVTETAGVDSSVPQGASAPTTTPASAQTGQASSAGSGAPAGATGAPGSAGTSTAPGGGSTGTPTGPFGGSARPGTPSVSSAPRFSGGMPGAGAAGVPVAPIRPGVGLPGASAGAGSLFGAPLGGGAPVGTGMSGSAGPHGAAGNGFMGGPAGAAGQRSNDDEHSRAVQPHVSPTGSDDLTGPLGESTPDVIGATHADEIISSDYEQDQF
ncbi:hypothetical protein [Nocardia sp. CNY236]|uniref:hypothetical protein n=1 Tax=Nocardia sp. CNY236 TaxID=1169152 RepID=UPI0003F86A4A|nr:hypothetical protein [Nocardia sp. CNY236]